MTERRDEEIINQIAKVRMANNIQWMRVLEIALQHAPDKTKCVLRNINSNDRIITDLLKDLAE
jgi:hypothetical protein